MSNVKVTGRQNFTKMMRCGWQWMLYDMMTLMPGNSDKNADGYMSSRLSVSTFCSFIYFSSQRDLTFERFLFSIVHWRAATTQL